MITLNFDLATLLKDVVSRNASDLHLIYSVPPIARVAGEIGALSYPPLDSEAIEALLEPYISESQHAQFRAELRLNFSLTLQNVGRFRINVYQSLGTTGATIRVIPSKTHALSELGLPSSAAALTTRRAGLILVTGATGSGKSTTLASMLEHINQHGKPSKIITIEDPIETLFKPCRCVFVQREVGTDTPSFETGTLDALRQDPDILCIGELRDLKSIRAALLAAETGHLVLTTLHTQNASKTAQRIVASFPEGEQDEIRQQLASSLEAVISQELLVRADGKGQVLAAEVLLATPAVRQLIRENKLDQINDAIQVGREIGMVSKDSVLKDLYQKGLITRETAAERMRSVDLLKR